MRSQEALTQSRLMVAQWIYAARERRPPAGLPGVQAEPAWEILLDLFINRTLGKRVAINAACVASRAPSTTALRHIRIMCDAGMVRRIPDGDDRRRLWLELTEETARAMEEYLDVALVELRKMIDGLPPGI